MESDFDIGNPRKLKLLPRSPAWDIKNFSGIWEMGEWEKDKAPGMI